MMKIFYLCIGLVVGLPLLSQAQTPSMREMAITQLYQYGQAVHDRGDDAQAALIISRVLIMDASHPGARKLAETLNKKGAHILIPAKPQPVTLKPVEQKSTVIPSKDQDDLKQQIAATDQAIEQLKNQVSELRNQLSQGQQ